MVRSLPRSATYTLPSLSTVTPKGVLRPVNGSTVGIFRADDLVGRRHDGVGTRLRWLVERRGVHHQVIALPLERGAGDGLADRVGGDRHRVRTGRGDDLGHVQLLAHRERPLVVGDRSVGALHLRRRPVIPDAAVTDAPVELLAGTFSPGAVGCGVGVWL